VTHLPSWMPLCLLKYVLNCEQHFFLFLSGLSVTGLRGFTVSGSLQTTRRHTLHSHRREELVSSIPDSYFSTVALRQTLHFFFPFVHCGFNPLKNPKSTSFSGGSGLTAAEVGHTKTWGLPFDGRQVLLHMNYILPSECSSGKVGALVQDSTVS
jgi:hypothetical protein